MNNESYDQQEEDKPLLQRLRGSVFPVKPTDTTSVKLLKDSAFYLFAVMALLVTLLLGGAIMFVL
ncbi:hypothetical protein SAMN05660461_1956 [Chitinophaga ginsengisegetis]|uniref:Uncharacterized protein n=1 Tax=Chitinophaga ginsengisegetis TaxID=393003 RepID=A0A1T5NK30_9BACT|nr:hypothetical protein [Chitinophaga ginsengisegetis]MDR6565100.1 hypothetical protein [Chitinophaga ginsengisegetis]MDR6644827.1 hypothetical protein [Chitinophaga ginsengisegetis]MDR6652581.1 hypothetical protein [Chitinophaga ginsengisegetis]SKD00792.1 hypothetical protein SAMN05660461_1956 [Chitinophaga ginsengisegetis]